MLNDFRLHRQSTNLLNFISESFTTTKHCKMVLYCKNIIGMITYSLNIDLVSHAYI